MMVYESSNNVIIYKNTQPMPYPNLREVEKQGKYWSYLVVVSMPG